MISTTELKYEVNHFIEVNVQCSVGYHPYSLIRTHLLQIKCLHPLRMLILYLQLQLQTCQVLQRREVTWFCYTLASDDNSSRSINIRILFNTGSQRSYITESLAKRLNLKPLRKERIQLNTFGEPGFRGKSCDLQ